MKGECDLVFSIVLSVCIVTVKNIFLFGLWAKILFRIQLHPKCLHGFVHGCNKDGVHESHVRLTPLEDF